MNFRTFVAALYLGLFATSVFAQQAKPQGGAVSFPSAEGPFGLTFGRPLPNENLKIRSKIDFQNDGGESANKDEKYLKQSCMLAAFQTTTTVPQAWKGSVDAIYGANKVPKAASEITNENKLNIDLTLGGDLTGAIYEIPIGGKNRNICLVFYKGNLFLVYAYLSEFEDMPTSLDAALESKYGKPKALFFPRSAINEWNIEKDRLRIETISASSFPSEVSYTFYPVKGPQIKALVDANWQKFKDATRKTPF